MHLKVRTIQKIHQGILESVVVVVSAPVAQRATTYPHSFLQAITRTIKYVVNYSLDGISGKNDWIW